MTRLSGDEDENGIPEEFDPREMLENADDQDEERLCAVFSPKGRRITKPKSDMHAAWDAAGFRTPQHVYLATLAGFTIRAVSVVAGKDLTPFRECPPPDTMRKQERRVDG